MIKQTLSAIQQPDTVTTSPFRTSGGIVRQPASALNILRMKQVIERTKLSRATIYILMATDSKFPQKIKLSARAVGYLECEVDAWIAARAESRHIAQ